MKEKEFAMELAKKTGKLLLKNFRKDYSILSLRGLAKEVTTKYDKMSDKLIVKEISKEFPDHNILTEESGLRGRNSEFTWMVDSLDGSGNFAVGNPFFSISIALLHHNKPILGVAYAPFLKELFMAEDGRGTLLNGVEVNVSKVEKLEESYLVSCEGGEKSNVRISRVNASLHPIVKDMRKLGSAAIECAWVSCGRCEGYMATKMSPWDIAAGVILVEEAGGKITDFKGNAWKPVVGDVVFSNGRIHEKILKVTKER